MTSRHISYSFFPFYLQTVCTLFLYNATRENVIAVARLGTDNPPLNSSQAQSLQHLLRVKVSKLQIATILSLSLSPRPVNSHQFWSYLPANPYSPDFQPSWLALARNFIATPSFSLVCLSVWPLVNRLYVTRYWISREARLGRPTTLSPTSGPPLGLYCLLQHFTGLDNQDIFFGVGEHRIDANKSKDKDLGKKLAT